MSESSDLKFTADANVRSEGFEAVSSRDMEVASDTAVVMTTRDGERYLARQIGSILEQSVLPAVIAIVDDGSRDGSRRLVGDIARTAPVPIELIAVDGSGHRDLKTRVAATVMRGLEVVADFEYTILSDQDDEWLPGRLAGQRALLQQHPGALLVAGDGLLIDAAGRSVGGSLRDRFPLPTGWDHLPPAERVRAAIRQPFVTGATCALRRRLVTLMTPVPPRWLFDRWATLVAASQDGLVLQREVVIRYRVHGDQVLGDRQAEPAWSGPRWRQVLARGASPLEAATRAGDVVGRIRPLATDRTIRDELTWRAMARAAFERGDHRLVSPS